MDDCIIVFKGVPEMIIGHAPGNLEEAEEFAAEKCELTHESYTVMVVPYESVHDKSLTAVYKGVMLGTTQEVMNERA